METITRVYNNYSDAAATVSALERAGIASSNISLIANKTVSSQYAEVDDASDAATGLGVGAVAGGTVGLLTGLGLLAIPGLGPVVAAGWLAATAVGAVAGGTVGGIVGALVSVGVPEEHAEVYSEVVRRGGTLLSVKADASQSQVVHDIVDRHGPVDPVSRAVEFRNSGWTKFDPDAPAYSASESTTERIRRVS